MNTDFKSLEKRYGTPFALKLHEEIARVERKHFAFYRIPPGLKALHRDLISEDDMPLSPLLPLPIQAA